MSAESASGLAGNELAGNELAGKGSTDDQLRRSYSRLLWAFPRWYRQERGLELLTTLLDDAPAGQRRPGRAEIVDLLGSGLRARLRLPRGRLGGYLVAVMTALFVAALGASLGSPYLRPATEAEAIRAAAVAVPLVPRNVPGPAVQCDLICPGWDRHDDVVAFDGPPDRSDRVLVWFDPAPAQALDLVGQAHDRLLTAGWRVDPVQVQPDGVQTLAASAHGTRIRLVGWPVAGEQPTIQLLVTRTWSPASGLSMAVGFLVGLLAGWLTAAWVLQRYRRHRPVVRALVPVAGFPTLVVLGSSLAITLLLVATRISSAELSPRDVLYPLFVATVIPWLPAIVGGSVLVTLLLLALPPGQPGQPPGRGDRHVPVPLSPSSGTA